MMTNILKHATHGHLLVRRFTDGTGGGVDVMAMDKGPGIGDIVHAIENGYSTVGTPGRGLAPSAGKRTSSTSIRAQAPTRS